MAPLVLDDMNKLMQLATLACLGIDPASPGAFATVRIGWQRGGAPAWKINEDVVVLRCTEEDDDYNRQRDEKYTTLDAQRLNDTFTYTRVWRITWSLYGPNSFDNARKIRSGMFLQSIHDQLAPSNVYLVTDVSAPQRVPEYFQGQWWERIDFNAKFNEGVTETQPVNAIATSEIQVYTKDGKVADITVS